MTWEVHIYSTRISRRRFSEEQQMQNSPELALDALIVSPACCCRWQHLPGPRSRSPLLTELDALLQLLSVTILRDFLAIRILYRPVGLSVEKAWVARSALLSRPCQIQDAGLLSLLLAIDPVGQQGMREHLSACCGQQQQSPSARDHPLSHCKDLLERVRSSALAPIQICSASQKGSWKFKESGNAHTCCCAVLCCKIGTPHTRPIV